MKKITRRSFLAVCGTVAAAAALTACVGSASSASTTASSVASAASSTAEKAAGTLSGNVATGGSTSMKNVIAALTEGFAEVEPGVTVSYDPTGSGAGITGATDKTLDIGLSSRALKDDEKAEGLKETVLAYDGIAIIVNPENPVNNLDLETIAKLYTGEITNWKELGGADANIVVVSRDTSSGTYETWEEMVMKKAKVMPKALLQASNGAVEQVVAKNPNAIGYASLSAVEGKDTVKAVTVGGVACTEETVLDGSYAIQRPFVLVTKTDAPLSTAAQAFFDYATSTAANDLIKAAGAVPVAK